MQMQHLGSTKRLRLHGPHGQQGQPRERRLQHAASSISTAAATPGATTAMSK